jgi:hypothetical protein
MKRSIQYESLWGECLFYYLLELDPLIVRYYEQPVNVPTKKLLKDFTIKDESHVPDLLLFRQGIKPQGVAINHKVRGNHAMSPLALTILMGEMEV